MSATPPAAPAPTTEAEKPQELGAAGESETETASKSEGPPEEMSSLREPTATSTAGKIPAHFYAWFWSITALAVLLLFVYFWRMDGEQLEILRELVGSVVPLVFSSPPWCWR